MSLATRPKPLVDNWNKPFWAACAEGKLRLQRCTATGKCFYPPAPVSLSFPEAAETSASVGPDWRMVLVLEQTPVAFAVAGGTLNLTGGLSTDRSVIAPAAPGALRLYRELGPVGLSTKTPRRTWAEGFRMD